MSPFSPPPLDMLKLGWNSVHGYVIYYKKKKIVAHVFRFLFSFFFFFIRFRWISIRKKMIHVKNISCKGTDSILELALLIWSLLPWELYYLIFLIFLILFTFFFLVRNITREKFVPFVYSVIDWIKISFFRKFIIFSVRSLFFIYVIKYFGFC